jgi:small subunit ribosomal protein S4e
MARGPKKHLKRLNAPAHWMLNKLGGIWAPRPSTGPHKLRECLPIALILRNRLKYALTRREIRSIVQRRYIKVDGKVRTDMNYPAGFQDVVSIEKTNEKFRLLYDTKGRFALHRIGDEEAAFKLLRVQKASKAKKATIGRNPFVAGQAASIPYVVTHDGRTVRYPNPAIKVDDVIKFDFIKNKIVDHIPFAVGSLCYITKGRNCGRIGTILNRERHPGSYDIVHVKDKKGHVFATRSGNIFVIAKGDEALISIPKSNGVKSNIFEERGVREKFQQKLETAKSKKL